MLLTDFSHNSASLERLTLDILCLGENTKVFMEVTGRYHEPVARELHEHGMLFECVSSPGATAVSS